ncbi:MAG: YhcH/YjgK/YiaL family protein [Bacteroidales bacterium]|nr:YhcH/YjgK/YiaL family protein [Bacteroidales bacterium]
MKKVQIIVLVTFALFCISTYAQCKKNNATEWMLSRCWSNGFKALPDVCTNLVEFQDQYNKNKAQWDAAFKWLAETDLLNIKAGKYNIEGTTMTASIEDDTTGLFETKGSESHYHHVDIQYVVKGTERFGLLDHDTSYPKTGYRPDNISYTFDPAKVMLIDSTPNRFFLFFPSDWHIAKIATDKGPEPIRVVVVKVDYVK